MSYSSELGRWVQQDPARYIDGMSLYEGLSSSPATMLDADGLQAGVIGGQGPQTIGGPKRGGGPTTQPDRELQSWRDGTWYLPDNRRFPGGPTTKPAGSWQCYRLNRKLGGGPPRDGLNPLTHTFIFTTGPDGQVRHTYSWGNDGRSWNLDRPEDVSAANAALNHGDPGRTVGNGTEAFNWAVNRAFEEFLRDPSQSHGNGWITQNCKTEADELLDGARELYDIVTTPTPPPEGINPPIAIR
jgi:hypothetical protein